MNLLRIYLLFVYLSTYINLYLNLPLHTALTINTLSMLIITSSIPIMGYCSDKIGRKPMLLFGAIGIGLLAYPLFLILEIKTFAAITTVQLIFALLIACCYGVTPALLAEMFATPTRYSAIALPYNIANVLFGSTAPLVATLLIHFRHSLAAPSFYLIFAAFIMLIIVINIPETYRKVLQ